MSSDQDNNEDFDSILDTCKTNDLCLELSNYENEPTDITKLKFEKNNVKNFKKEIMEPFNSQSNNNSDEQPQVILYPEDEIKKCNNNPYENLESNENHESININNEQNENNNQKYNNNSEKKNELNNSNIQKNINIDEKIRNNKNNENDNIKNESSIKEKIETFKKQKNNSILKFYPFEIKKTEENNNQTNYNNNEKNKIARKEYLFKKMFTITTEILIKEINEKLINKKLKKVKLISEYNYNNYQICLEKTIRELLSKNEKIEKKISLHENPKKNLNKILEMNLKEFITDNDEINEKYKKFFNEEFLKDFKGEISFIDYNSIEKLIKEIETNKGNKKKFFKIIKNIHKIK